MNPHPVPAGRYQYLHQFVINDGAAERQQGWANSARSGGRVSVSLTRSTEEASPLREKYITFTMSLISAIITHQSLKCLAKSEFLKNSPFIPNLPPYRPLIRPLYSPPSAQAKLRLQVPSALRTFYTVIPTASSQISIPISRNMANYSLSSTEASVSVRPRHGSGALINFTRVALWICSHCQHINNRAYCPQQCGNCGHMKCVSCTSYMS